MTLREKTLALLGTWSRPPDLPAKIALVLAVALALTAAFGRGRGLLFGYHDDSSPEAQRTERRRLLATLGFIAGLLSIAYIAVYLRGGPRIIDATTYFLQGRAFSHGDFAWTPPEGPSASFRGRFLVYRDLTPEGSSLGGIFPPGYPLILSLGFLLGAPMLVGPLIAIALVVATYHLARTIAEEACPALAEPIARSAALLSIFCAALRYHTADTMSHGATALGVTVALTCALRARQTRRRQERSKTEDLGPFARGRLEALFSGLALGWVLSTRPVSALPIALVIACVLAPVSLGNGRRPKLLIAVLLGSLPGIVLLLAAQREVTGSWLASTQRMYYALSDGPPGCFRWGFGQGIGCEFEHGDFVRARLEGGYGLVAAAGTTVRRLHAHLLDVANLEPLALLVLVPVLLRRTFNGRTGILAASALVALQMLAYVPFYFDGDYPGGGARFFADVLPIEHALVMLAVAALVKSSAERFARGAYGVLALALAGFGIHASYEHAKLRDRDGGRPMFEPDVLARANITNGLVFVDTDHGFALGHDPAARPDKRVVVARLRNDDRDRMLWSALGRPVTYLYKRELSSSTNDLKAPSDVTVTPWTPPESGALLKFEAEAEWPALFQENGFAAPAFTDACASGKQALVVTPEPGQRARASITIPVPTVGEWSVEIHTVAVPPLPAPGASKANAGEARVTIDGTRWNLLTKQDVRCMSQPARTLSLRPPHAILTVEVAGHPLGIDYVGIRKTR